MTREEAIKAIEEYLDTADEAGHIFPIKFLNALDEAVSALSDYDKMQKISLDLAFENDELMNKSRWISVSERLPNHDEYIKNNGLFNVSDGNRSYSEWFDISDKQRFGEPTMSGFRVDYAVTAWQPLPEPYKAESEVKPNDK